MNLTRIEAFSDGVFAFAFTLLILDFKVPESTADLFAHFHSLWPQLLAYTITALLIGLIWSNHRAMFQHFENADRLTVFLNTLLLANVAFLPFPTALLSRAISTGQGLNAAAFMYGLVLTIGGIFFKALWLYATWSKQVATKSDIRKRAKLISAEFSFGPISYGLATVLALYFPWISITLYVLLIVYFWLPGHMDSMVKVER